MGFNNMASVWEMKHLHCILISEENIGALNCSFILVKNMMCLIIFCNKEKLWHKYSIVVNCFDFFSILLQPEK